MGRYDLVMRDLHHGERFQAGRNDLCMAVYLPGYREPRGSSLCIPRDSSRRPSVLTGERQNSQSTAS
jgi:hypothetical protein